MKTIEDKVNLKDLSVTQKRYEILVGGRIVERDKINRAVLSINRLRRKIKGWNSTKEIRKWRKRE